MNITIQEADKNHLDQVYNLLWGLAVHHKMEHKFLITKDQFFKEKDHYGCLVALSDNEKVVGIATYFFSYHTWVGRSIYLDDFFVMKSYRKQGIGSMLFESLIKLAQDEGCHRIRWQVAEWNTKAIAFYERYGARIEMEERSCNLEGKALMDWQADEPM